MKNPGYITNNFPVFCGYDFVKVNVLVDWQQTKYELIAKYAVIFYLGRKIWNYHKFPIKAAQARRTC